MYEGLSVEEELVRALSAPDKHFLFEDFFGYICASHHSFVVARALTLINSSPNNGQLVEHVASSTANTKLPSSYPMRHFSNFRIERLLNNQNDMAYADIDQIMVNLVMMNIIEDYQLKTKNEKIFIGNKIYFTGADIRSISNLHGKIIITARSGSRFHYDEEVEVPKNDGTNGIFEISPVDPAHRNFSISTPEHVPVECFEHIDHEVILEKDNVRECISSGLSLLRESSKEYYRWCELASPHIIPVASNNGAMLSGSQQMYPGLVYVSGDVSPLKMCEMLIHEASHQYFHALERVGRLKEAGSKEWYFSPVVGRERPSDKLLLAYHAFLNVLIFMNSMDDSEISESDKNFLIRNKMSVEKDLKGLSDGLNKASDLTETGEMLWSLMKKRTCEISIQ